MENCYQNVQKVNQVAIVMVPLPAQGHLNQLLHLSHLMASYDLPVHYACSTVHNKQAKLRFHGWDRETSQKIEFHDLPLPPYRSPPPNPNACSTHFPAHLQPLFDASMHLRKPMFQLFQDLSTKFRRIVIIHDNLMSLVVQDTKLIPNAEAYIFYPVSVFTIFMSIWESLAEKPFQLDSEIPSSIPSSEYCFTPETRNFISKNHKFRDFQSGRLFNTSRVIEGRYLELFDRLSNNANFKSFAIGPFNAMEIIKRASENRRHGCLKWLDKQEVESVIYVSFGSSTLMSNEQNKNLAKGLEESGHKFIWVLRIADKGDIFEGDEEERVQLPEGFEERVRNRGMVVRDWAPQLEILGHSSIGWFMSHCGWNSCLESLSMGVPIAAWPMHSDQPKNAILLTGALRIGIMVREWKPQAELVTSDAIENMVKILMTSKEGKETGKRAAELGKAVRGSLAEGGASRLEMESFIAHITG